MAQIYCPPIAVSIPKFSLLVNQSSTFIVQSVTLGFKPHSISRFISLLSSSPSKGDLATTKEDKKESDEIETIIQLSIVGGAVYYQPSSNLSNVDTSSFSIVPPRAILTIGDFKVLI